MPSQRDRKSSRRGQRSSSSTYFYGSQNTQYQEWLASTQEMRYVHLLECIFACDLQSFVHRNSFSNHQNQYLLSRPSMTLG